MFTLNLTPLGQVHLACCPHVFPQDNNKILTLIRIQESKGQKFPV